MALDHNGRGSHHGASGNEYKPASVVDPTKTTVQTGWGRQRTPPASKVGRDPYTSRASPSAESICPLATSIRPSTLSTRGSHRTPYAVRIASAAIPRCTTTSEGSGREPPCPPTESSPTNTTCIDLSMSRSKCGSSRAEASLTHGGHVADRNTKKPSRGNTRSPTAGRMFPTSGPSKAVSPSSCMRFSSIVACRRIAARTRSIRSSHRTSMASSEPMC